MDGLQENNLFDNTNVEFPVYCRPMWSKAQEAQVAITGAKMLPCWKKQNLTATDALDDEKIDAISSFELPFLNSTQFAEFYSCISQGEEAVMTLTGA